MKIENVLLVDDDPMIRRVSEIALTRVGRWNVRVAESGKAALDVLSTFRPDVILLDVMMPGMDGPTMLEILKGIEHYASIPVIFMTAKVQSHEIHGYYDLGAAGVITKPFDPMMLPRDIQLILDRAERRECIA